MPSPCDVPSLRIDPEYGYGLALSGTVVENEAFKGIKVD